MVLASVERLIDVTRDISYSHQRAIASAPSTGILLLHAMFTYVLSTTASSNLTAHHPLLQGIMGTSTVQIRFLW